MPDAQTEMLKEAIDYIEKNLREPLTVTDVCSLFPISKWEFQRWFRAHVGDSIGNYIRSRRLTESLGELKKDSGRNILDVAIEFQFSSQEAFTRAFKTYFGATPGDARSSNKQFDRLLKPRVTSSLLEHLRLRIEREPQFKVLGPLRLVGLKKEMKSIHRYSDFEVKAPQLWREFLSRIHEIEIIDQNKKYGVAIDIPDSLEEEIEYFAAVECKSEADIPPGMTTLDMPVQSYAVFENIGLAGKSRETIDYIYGFWLPQSGYTRAPGFDFEIFDERYSLEDAHSVSLYCLPIDKKR